MQKSCQAFEPWCLPSNMSMMSEKKTTEKYCWAASSELGCRLVRRNRVACMRTQRNDCNLFQEYLFQSKGFCWPPLSLTAGAHSCGTSRAGQSLPRQSLRFAWSGCRPGRTNAQAAGRQSAGPHHNNGNQSEQKESEDVEEGIPLHQGHFTLQPGHE